MLRAGLLFVLLLTAQHGFCSSSQEGFYVQELLNETSLIQLAVR